MISNAILKIHNFMLAQMMEWCSSYHTMVLTMWLCLVILLYLFFISLLKTLRLSNKKKEQYDIPKTICRAIEENNIVKCIKLLEEYPHCVNKYTRDGYTPFLVACANGNTQLIKIMLKKGADVTLKSLKKESAFYLAAFYYIKYPQLKNATCIRELYYAGADINEGNEKCFTPLQLAAMFGHTALVNWLLMKNASIRTIPDPYVIARSQGHQDTAKAILRFTVNFALTYK